MINTYLMFEVEIPNGSKVVALTGNCTKFLSLKANLPRRSRSPVCKHVEDI